MPKTLNNGVGQEGHDQNPDPKVGPSLAAKSRDFRMVVRQLPERAPRTQEGDRGQHDLKRVSRVHRSAEVEIDGVELVLEIRRRFGLPRILDSLSVMEMVQRWVPPFASSTAPNAIA